MGVCCKAAKRVCLGEKPKKKEVKPVQLYTKAPRLPYSGSMYDRYDPVKDMVAFPKDASVTEIVQAIRDDHMKRAGLYGKEYTQEAKAQVVRAEKLKERYAKIDKLDAAIVLLGGA